MRFLNRSRELARLNGVLDRDSLQFVTVYGRRRCGKSTLLRELVRDRSAAFYVCAQVADHLQLSSFARVVENIIPGFAALHYPSWDVALREALTRCPEGSVFVIDEFPYLQRELPAAASLIQRLLEDRGPLRGHLILCGSSQQMMEVAILRQTAPLYGRADAIVKLSPLRAGWITLGLDLDARAGVEEYAVWGGIPRYWELRERHTDLAAALREEVLTPEGALHDEPLRLLLDESRTSVQANSVLAVVAAGANRLSEIAGRLGAKATSLSRILQRLIELGYLERDVPFGETTRSTKRLLYRVADPFFRFHYRFVTKARSALALPGGVEATYAEFDRNRAHFVAPIWERLCRDACYTLPTLNNLKLRDAARWWGTGIDRKPLEVDVVAHDPDAGVLFLGECKWSSTTDTAAVLRELRAKAPRLPFFEDYQRVEYRVFVAEGSGADVVNSEDVIGALRY